MGTNVSRGWKVIHSIPPYAYTSQSSNMTKGFSLENNYFIKIIKEKLKPLPIDLPAAKGYIS